MERLPAGGSLVAVLLACALNLPGQAAPQNSSTATPAAGPILPIPEGERLVLELQDSLNTRHNQKGDRVEFTTSNEVLVGDTVAISLGSQVRATVTEVKRPGHFGGRAEIRLHFDELVLLDGTTMPISANLLRAGIGESDNKGNLVLKGESGRGGTLGRVAQTGAQGAILGGLGGGLKGAAKGAAAGAMVGLILSRMRRGPDLDLPRGMMFEIELANSLGVPVAAARKSVELAASKPLPSPDSASGPMHFPRDTNAREDKPEPPPDFSKIEPPASPPTDSSSTTANRTPSPPPAAPTPPPAGDLPSASELKGYKIHSDVNLVLVDVTIRNSQGKILDNLKQEDFRLYEDGKEQKIQHFSRDELPLALALVVDRSGSVAPFFNELRHAAYETLRQLKPGDEVALFSFAHDVERLEDLTTDRQRIADSIAQIRAGGGTNIVDAIYEAAQYLRLAAPNRRRAIILVSDNQGNVRGFASERQAINMALEADTVIYSVKTRGVNPMGLLMPVFAPGGGNVRKMASETGGEIIDADREGSLRAALATAITRLKMRYTLGYPMPQSEAHDSAFRKVDVRLTDRFGHPGRDYTIQSRRGYYAPRQHAASTNRTQPKGHRPVVLVLLSDPCRLESRA